MMKILTAAALAGTMALAGCNTTEFDKFAQSSAPYACANLSEVYSLYTMSAPSEKELNSVEKYYKYARELCKSPSTITARQLAAMVATAVAMKRATKRG